MACNRHYCKQVVLNKNLFKAIAQNDTEKIANLIDLGASVNSEFTIGELFDYKLIDENAISILRKAKNSVNALRINANIDDTNVGILNSYKEVIFLPARFNKIFLGIESKLSTLQLAVLYGWKETIIKLIKEGANPNKKLDIQGITVLQLMCTSAVFRDKELYLFDETIIQLLFDHGADPNVQDITGKTFLHYAVLQNDYPLDENLRAFITSDNAPDTFDYVRKVEIFLINGANPNIKDKFYHCTLLYRIVEYDKYLNEQSRLINLLLNHASIYGTYKDVMKNPDIISMMKEDHGRSYGTAEAKKQVEDFNSRHQQHVEKNYQFTEAIKNQNTSKITALLNEDISPNIRDKEGLSPLHLAVKIGDYHVVDLLLRNGANPGIKSWESGTTPLFNAVINNRIDLAELLLKNGANPSVINFRGLSPLYFSITQNNVEMNELLLKYNADPDISSQILLLLNNLIEIRNDSYDKIAGNSLTKIKNVAKFLKSRHIFVDYSLFYQTADIAEIKGKKNTAKKILELIDELTFPS